MNRPFSCPSTDLREAVKPNPLPLGRLLRPLFLLAFLGLTFAAQAYPLVKKVTVGVYVPDTENWCARQDRSWNFGRARYDYWCADSRSEAYQLRQAATSAASEFDSNALLAGTFYDNSHHYKTYDFGGSPRDWPTVRSRLKSVFFYNENKNWVAGSYYLKIELNNGSVVIDRWQDISDYWVGTWNRAYFPGDSFDWNTPLDLSFSGAVDMNWNTSTTRNINLSDPDGSGSIRTWATSSNQDIISNGSLTIDGSGDNRTLNIRPSANRFGTCNVTVYANDGATERQSTISITVRRVQQPPTIAVAANPGRMRSFSKATGTLRVGDEYTAAGSLTVQCVASSDANIIPVSRVSVAGGNEDRTFTIDGTSRNAAATVTLTFRVTDGDSQTREVTAAIDVTQDTDESLPVTLADAGSSGVSFVRTDDQVTVPAGTWFKGDFTIEAWVYRRGNRNWSRILDFGNGAGVDNVILTLSHADWQRPSLFVWGDKGDGQNIVSSEQVPLNRWTHVAATVSGGTGRIYLNGRKVAEGVVGTPRNVSRTRNYIGASNWGSVGDPAPDATYDEVRIWNKARTEAELAGFAYPPLDVNASGLIGYWTFDNGRGNAVPNLAKDTGAGIRPNDATAQALFPKYTAGIPNTLNITPQEDVPFNLTRLLTGNGSSLSWNVITPPSRGSLGSPTFTVNATARSYQLISAALPWGQARADAIWRGGHLAVITSSAESSAVNGVAGGTAAWIGATDEVVEGSWRWVTGETWSYTQWNPGEPNNVNGEHYAQRVSGGNWNDLPGTATVGAYVLELPPTDRAQVAVTFTPEPNFNVTTGGEVSFVYEVKDGARQLFSQKVVARIQAVNDAPIVRTDGYLQLGGSGVSPNNSQYLYVPGSELVFAAPGTNALTLEAWVRPDRYGGRFLNKQNQGVWGEYFLELQDGGLVSFFREHAPWTKLTSPAPIPLNQWTHVAAVYDGAKRQLYLNGQLVAEDQDAIAIGSGANLLQLGAGQNQNAPYQFFTGGLDEVRIWNVARTASQIAASMAAPLSGFESGLQGYYRFNEGFGIWAQDLTPASTKSPLDGLLAGGASFQAGANTVNNIRVPEDSPGQEIVLVAQDVDGDANLTYAISANPANGRVFRVTELGRSFYKYAPNADYTGADSFRYRVTDSAGASSEGTVNITVVDVNDAPTLEPISNQLLEEQEEEYQVPIVVNDVDNALADLNVSATSSESTILRDSGIRVVGTGKNRMLMLSPFAGSFGSTRLRVTVSDGLASAEREFEVSFVPKLAYALLDVAEPGKGAESYGLAVDDSGRLGGYTLARAGSTAELPLVFEDLNGGGVKVDLGSRAGRVQAAAYNTKLDKAYQVGTSPATAGVGLVPFRRAVEFYRENVITEYQPTGGGASVKQTNVITYYRTNEATLRIPAGYTNGVATTVNAAGTLAGYLTQLGVDTPFIAGSSLDAVTSAQFLSGVTEGRVNALNLYNTAAGFLVDSGTRRQVAFLHDGTSATRLNPPAGYQESAALGLNDNGVVAGYLVKNGAKVAALYRDGQWTVPTGALVDTWVESRAHGINNFAQVIGEAKLRDGTTRAFLWSGGTVYDLNSLIPEGSPWRLESARAINKSGQIVGIGRRQNDLGQAEVRAFLAHPASVIGKAIRRPEGSVARYPVIDFMEGGPGDNAGNSFFWSDVDRALYAIRPSKAVIRWHTSLNPITTNLVTIPSLNVNVWPLKPEVHIAGTPVDAHPAAENSTYSYYNLQYSTTPGAAVDSNTRVFNTATNGTGYSVVRYLITGGLPPDPTTQSNRFTVARTFVWNDPRVFSDTKWTIGTPLVDAEHSDYPGRNGYVFFAKSAYDAVGLDAAYNREARTGTIVPVNVVNRAAPVNDQDLVVAWYRLNALGVAWSRKAVRYAPEWPANPPKIIIASQMGSNLEERDPITAITYPQARVYVQEDPALAGFNPNEEHALILPSSNGEAVFALRNDLNRYKNYSEPFVLLKYRDFATRRWLHRVYRVVTEEAPYFFQYRGIVGTEIQPPYPLSILPLTPENYIAAGHDIALEDYKGKIYARNAELRGQQNSDLDLRFFYPLQPGFWYDLNNTLGNDAAVGTSVAWLDSRPGGTPGTPVPVRYTIRWPDTAPVLEVGETLFRAKHGLPNVADMAAVRVVHDSLNPDFTGTFKIGPGFLTVPPTNIARLYDPVSENLLELPASFAMPDQIRLQDAPAGRKAFRDLPYPLRLRLSFDPINKLLGFKGHYDDTQAGEPLLLPNIMTLQERERIKQLADGDTVFAGYIDDLYRLTRNPNQLDLNKDGNPDDAFLIGYQYKVVGTNFVNGIAELEYDTNFIEMESLPNGLKALTAAVGNNVPAPPNPGSALKTVGGTDAAVVTGLPTSPLTKFSFEVWVKRAQGGRADWFVSRGTAVDGLQAGFRADNYVEFQLGGVTAVSTRPYVDANEWHHWAGVFSGETKTLRLYRDGVQVGEREITFTQWRPAGDVRWGLGRSGTAFRGSLDEARLWHDKARSAVELLANRYQTLVSGQAGLAGYWTFDDVAFSDMSGNGRNAAKQASATAESAVGQNWGVPPRFLTLIENDNSALAGLPVTLKVIAIGEGPFAGDLKVIYPDNVFDERLTLMTSSDFGGQPENFTFEWWYKPDAPDFKKSVLPVVGDDGTVSDARGWIPYTPGNSFGKNSITLGEGGEGGLLVLADNWFIARYKGYNVGNRGLVWSPWIGDPSSKGTPQPMLAEGWVKRVVRGLNPFDERVADLTQAAASTKTSMLQQAGMRYEGDIAFNPDADAINRVGLIEAYETVLRRARSLSTDGTPPVNYQPANNALLFVGSRIADLYTMIGNEAMADAADPSIGLTTDMAPYNTGASSIFAFQNQLDSLLEEELALLRGRDDSSAGVQAAPVYNRMFWNFTLGDGEVAYSQVYNVTDQNGDGKLDEKDGRILYPQGHGDAWGHYLTATKTYYQLLRNPNFTWVPRSENVLLAGVPVKVDYLDERKFAVAAAYKAKAGAEIVDLTYRQRFVDDPDGQWQGYSDEDADRAWGVDEWASRAGLGAYADWLMANAILPSVDPNPAHKSIDKIDRQTVPELREIAAQFTAIQAQMDKADQGLNPLGLAKGVVPFDLDPSLVDAGMTQFEQVAERAVDSLKNTLTAFNELNSMNQALRNNADTTDGFSAEVDAQEHDFKNRLIEAFGYPYAGDIGPGRTYPSGYDGPDLVHFMYVATKEINSRQASPSESFVGLINGLREEAKSYDLKLGSQPLLDDADSFETPDAPDNVTYPFSASGYAFEAPTSWGQRRAPGDIQTAISDLVQAEARLKQAMRAYDNLVRDVDEMLNGLDGEIDLEEQDLKLQRKARDQQMTFSKAILGLQTFQLAMARAESATENLAQDIAEAIPKSFVAGGIVVAGMAAGGGAVAGGDPGAPARSAIRAAGNFVAENILGIAQDLAEGTINGLEMAKEDAEFQSGIEMAETTLKYEHQQGVKEVLAKLREEAPLRMEILTQREVVQQTAGRLQSTIAAAQRVLEERLAFRKKVAGQATKLRYKDMAFRILRNDAIQKYRAQFDLSARYTYLAATAYDYESNLLGSDGNTGRAFLTDIVRQRAPGAMVEDVPVLGSQGLAAPLARMQQNFKVMKTQMGFNNPQTETGRFSVRRELFRLQPNGAAADQLWKAKLKASRVADLWKLPEFRRYCRPMAPEALGAQPGLVLRFPTTVTFGLNFFGWPLSGGDSAYDPTQFATKVRSVGTWFSGYDGNGMSLTPRIYLVPTGADVLRSPNGDNFETRLWRVVDQKLPLPFPIQAADLRKPEFIPGNDSVGGFAEIRKFSSFRAYHDGGDFDPAQAVSNSRLIGRSVWNTEWLLIIPGGTLLNDGNAGLDAFIDSVSDIKLFFQTYAYSGN